MDNDNSKSGFEDEDNPEADEIRRENLIESNVYEEHRREHLVESSIISGATTPAPSPKQQAAANRQQAFLDEVSVTDKKLDKANTAAATATSKAEREAALAVVRCHENHRSWLSHWYDTETSDIRAMLAHRDSLYNKEQFPLPYGLLGVPGDKSGACVVWLAYMLRLFNQRGAHWRKPIYKTAIEAAKATGLTVAQCQKAARKVVSWGWMTVTRHRLGRSQHPVNHYNLTAAWVYAPDAAGNALRLTGTTPAEFWGTPEQRVYHVPSYARMMPLHAAHLVEMLRHVRTRHTTWLTKSKGCSYEDASRAVDTEGMPITNKQIKDKLNISAEVLRDIKAYLKAWGVTLKIVSGKRKNVKQVWLVTANSPLVFRKRLTNVPTSPGH